MGVVCSIVLRDGGNDAEQDQEDDVDDSSNEIDCTSAEPVSQRPVQDVGNKSKAGVDQTELERLLGGNTCLLEEECRLVGNQISGEVLGAIGEAGNQCASEVGSTQQVQKCWIAAQFVLDGNGSLHHGEGPLRLFWIAVA